MGEISPTAETVANTLNDRDDVGYVSGEVKYYSSGSQKQSLHIQCDIDRDTITELRELLRESGYNVAVERTTSHGMQIITATLE